MLLIDGIGQGWVTAVLQSLAPTLIKHTSAS